MSTKARYNAGTQVFYDPAQSYEHPFAMAPMFYDEEFTGGGKAGGTFPTSATAGSDWVKKLTNAGTVAGVANGAGGQVACALAVTSEIEDAILNWGDQRALDVTKGLVVEMRAQLTVLPSLAGAQAVWGVGANFISGPDNITQYLQFGATANGAILLRSKDGTTTNAIASGVTVLTTEWHIYRIDATNLADIKYFIDGVQVSATAAVSFVATGANAVLQPYMGMGKTASAALGTLTVDYFRAWSNR